MDDNREETPRFYGRQEAQLSLGQMNPALVSATPEIQSIWAAFVRQLGHDPSERFVEAFHFDDNEPSANELADLVLRGRKCATAALQWAYESEGKQTPKPGSLSIVTRWSGVPVCVIETTSIEIMPFANVGADFAAAEGEGDGSLAFWQRAHTAFFGRECVRLGRKFVPSAPVVCERFRVVFPSTVETPA